MRIAETVDAGHGGNDQHIPPGQQGCGGGKSQLVQFLVDAGVLLHVGVSAGNVGLRLVVIVVGDEVFDGVVGEKFLELGGQLGGQGLVVGDDQGGPLHFLDDVGHGEGLAAAGNAQQGLVDQAVVDPIHQPLHGLGLVAGHLEVGSQLKIRHGLSLTSFSTKGHEGARSYFSRNFLSPRTQAKYKSMPLRFPAYETLLTLASLIPNSWANAW